jgi:hypothetical protein
MKNGYFGLIGLLIIMLLIAGCSGPSTTPSNTLPTTTSGSDSIKMSPAGAVRTFSITPTVKATDTGMITIFDNTKFARYEYVENTTGDRYKFESATGTFHGQPALLMRYTQTYGPRAPGSQNIWETYTDSAGNVLGGSTRSILGGKEVLNQESSASMVDPGRYDMKVPKNRVISSSTATVTVNAGIFVCDVYNLYSSEVRYFISPNIPVPIKMEYKYGYSWDLWAWG